MGGGVRDAGDRLTDVRQRARRDLRLAAGDSVFVQKVAEGHGSRAGVRSRVAGKRGLRFKADCEPVGVLCYSKENSVMKGGYGRYTGY